MTEAAATFTISDLAREFGITPRTIRFWEDQGILSPEREGSKRVFTRRDRARLKMALRGKRLGLSLAEIKDLIGMYNSTEDETPQLLERGETLFRRNAAKSILIAQHGEVRIVPVTPLAPSEILNPIGSGDAFLAGMVARLIAAASGPVSRSFTLDALEHACTFATACAQSNARTARPGFLENSFALDYRA